MSYRASIRLASQASKSLLRPATVFAASRIAVRATPVAVNQRFFSNSSLVQKNNAKQVLEVLNSEITLEKDINEHQEKPEVIDNFLESSGFKVVESNKRNLAEIVKDTGDSVVHVYFDVSQITNIPESSLLEEEEQANEELEFERELGEEFANVNIVVEKKAESSALSIEVLLKLDDGSLYVESVTPYADAKLALSESAESEALRQLTYHGPPFSNLDENLQTSIEDYIRELGLNESLGEFLVAFSEYKENKEYFNWLLNVKQFFS